MRFKQLEYFVAVAEVGSISKAATQLYVAQPSLSYQISTLEGELGGKLFDRLPRGIQLTAAGRAFLVEARKILAAAGRAQGIVRAVSEGNLGELRLATITSLALGIVPEAAAFWRTSHPNVTLSLEEFVHADLLEETARSGRCDLAIGPSPRHDVLTKDSIGFEEFVFVLASGDPLVRRERIDPSDMAERPWVLFSTDHGLSALVDSICSRWGFSPRPAARTGQVATAVKLAAAGLGPTLLPENCVDPDAGLQIRPLSKPVLREITAYADAPFSPLALNYIEAVKAGERVSKSRQTYPDAIYL